MICFDGAFHGRTLAMLSATGNPKYLDGFGAPVDGFDHVPFGNMNARARCDHAADRRRADRADPGRGRRARATGRLSAPTCARRATNGACCWRSTRCNAAWGAPARLFAYQQWPASQPDVLTAAKGIAGGFPDGRHPGAARAVAQYLTPGSHGTTFGGNPLAAAAANAVLDVILADGFLAGVRRPRRSCWRLACAQLVGATTLTCFPGVRGHRD